MSRCAVCRISDGYVVNVIIADPDAEPQDGCELHEIMGGTWCDIGGQWNGVDFGSPPLDEGQPE